ncbi:hypothetical protein [Burkholderia catarinensis]|uniref:hypothetical protein n=1 Tax=Burkholderia catarinensis TaxID=1108140 RepID=UPI0027E2FD30|nr:hypothetical protein [Burkholderia catarinensis]
MQLEIWQEQEFVEHEVFPRDTYWGVPDEHELRNGSCSVPMDSSGAGSARRAIACGRPPPCSASWRSPTPPTARAGNATAICSSVNLLFFTA